MKNFQFSFPISPVLKLSEIERILRRDQIIRPVPSRRTLINWIEDGTLNGQITSKGYYVVTVESFECLVKGWQILEYKIT